MTRVALLPSEPIRPRMAGIGIRYLELARRLPAHDLEVVLLTAGELEEVPTEGLPLSDLRRFERGRLGELLADCDVAISQGQLANDLLLEVPELPSVVDFYDPFLIENMHYASTLGLDPYRNDHATWALQLSRGDFFLCSCDEQRQFYLGFLAALGRVNPRLVEQDPDLQGLIAVAPFGIADPLPEPGEEPALPPRGAGERRLLFGGLYDWYDPWPVLEAFAQLDRPDWRLLFIRNPNPESTPQGLFGRVQRWCEQRGLWGERVQALDWVPFERRFDMLREVDLLVATHRASLETRLSLRTRFLEALAVGCPVITSEGGAMSRLLVEHGAGRVVPEGNSEAVGEALLEVLEPEGEQAGRVRLEAARRLLEGFSWERVLEPLVRFCRAPKVDPTKRDFAFEPPTRTPPDDMGFRLRRWWRRLAVNG